MDKSQRSEPGQGQVHASGLRDRWCRGPQPREAVVVRTATVMGFVGDEIRNNSGGQVAWTLVGHEKDTSFNPECSERILGFEQR